jgi:hypothetical protein|tara:strand:+ start:4771 stop:5385 length:615 start_codon:yes stop_codon:yes gene_type:complete
MPTYTNAIAYMADWAEDDSSEVAAAILILLTRAEERLFHDAPIMPIYKQKVVGNLIKSQAILIPPEKIRRIRSMIITVNGKVEELKFRTDSFLDKFNPSRSQGIPKFYNWSEETEFRLEPISNGKYPFTLRYVGLPAGLTATNANTFLSDTHFDQLMNAAMVLLETYLQHEEGAVRWEKLYQLNLPSFQAEALAANRTESGAGT